MKNFMINQFNYEMLKKRKSLMTLEIYYWLISQKFWQNFNQKAKHKK